jgi:hypothetical protein
MASVASLRENFEGKVSFNGSRRKKKGADRKVRQPAPVCFTSSDAMRFSPVRKMRWPSPFAYPPA